MLPAASTAADSGLANCAAVPVPFRKPEVLPASVVTCRVETSVNRVSSAPVKLAATESVGASFTAASVIVTVAAAEEAVPSEAVTEKVFAPFSFAAGTYVRFGKSASGITWAAVTVVPESFSSPVAGKVATVMLTSAGLSVSV